VWALGLSLAFHAVLVLLGTWVPLFSIASAPGPEETAVTFHFDPPSPLDMPEPAATPPAPAPTPPEPEPEPAPPEPAEEPLLRPRPEQGEGPLTEVPGIPPAGPPRARERQEEREPAPPARDPRPPQRDETGDPRRLDVARALREYEESLRDRAPAIEPTPRGESAPTDGYRPGPGAVPSIGFGMGNLVFQSGDYDWSDYARQVIVILERAVNHRIWVTLDDFERWAHRNDNWLIRPDQRVRVRFVIERNGDITGIEIEGPSGVAPFDAAVRDSLEEAIVPPLPASFPREREVVRVEGLFPAGAPIQKLRPAYERWKARGMF
jgi:TonB family protein